MPTKQMYQNYMKILKSLPELTCSEVQDDDGVACQFTSSNPNALDVELKWWQRGADFVMLSVEGVDTGYWHTAEEENLDYHIKLAEAALLGNVAYNRSPILKLKEVCFKIGDGWDCTLTDRASSYHYIKTRKNIDFKQHQ